MFLLQDLRNQLAAGWVSPGRGGQPIRYRLEISAVEEAMAFLMDIAGTGATAEITPPVVEPRR